MPHPPSRTPPTNNCCRHDPIITGRRPPAAHDALGHPLPTAQCVSSGHEARGHPDAGTRAAGQPQPVEVPQSRHV